MARYKHIDTSPRFIAEQFALAEMKITAGIDAETGAIQPKTTPENRLKTGFSTASAWN